MDHFRTKLLLLKAVYIATAVLLIMGQCPPQLGSDNDDCCAWNECLDHNSTLDCNSGREYTAITEISHILELSLNEKSQNFVPCGTNHCEWYKAGRCVNCITQFSKNQFSGGFKLNDQGNYFANTKNSGHVCNDTRLFVTIEGAKTYLGTFNFSHPVSEYRVVCIRRCVKKIYCQGSEPHQCYYAVREVIHINKSLKEVHGLLYLRDFPLKLEVTNTICNFIGEDCGSYSGSELKTSGIFQKVSFCGGGPNGSFSFPKTNIGMTANSTETCPGSKKPRATRLCRGDFIGPSSWDDPIVKNCNEEGDIYSTDNPVTIITTVTKDSALPTTNVLESTPVTTGNTFEAIMMCKENINDGTLVTKENVNEVSRMLFEATKTPECVDAAYLTWVSERIQDISEVGSSSPTVTRNVMEIVDNLLNVREDVCRESISRGAPSRILRALETQLTNLQKGEKHFTFVRSSVGAVARQLRRPVFGENITFGGFFPIEIEDIAENMNESKVTVMTGNDNPFAKYLATITLPLLDEISTGHNDRVPVTFIIYRTSLLFMSRSSQQRRRRESVESLVISATVEGQNISNLSSPVISRFQLPRVEGIITNNSRKCVFWDLTLADGFGDWSSEGCELVIGSQNDTVLMIECHCNHLTSFAVLLDVQGDIGHIVLDILSIIGCVVSIIALIITLVVLLAVKKLREQVPQKIIINLCFALLGLYICFLVGIGQSSLETGCIIFGALIHYFCLASVAWMCIVATNMYLLFVRVFNADVTGFMWKACLAAWGLPMVVVVVSVILKSQHYASSYCFPQAESLIFYVGVVLLIALMLCYNFIIFILIVRQVTCGRIGRHAGQDKRTEMFERAQSIIIISILVGLTWVFGFLSIGIARFFFNLLFLIFNSLQGFFVFVFFVLRPKNVRMILFRRFYRSQEKNTGKYTVNTTKTDGKGEQKDTLDIDDIVVTSSQSKIKL